MATLQQILTPLAFRSRQRRTSVSPVDRVRRLGLSGEFALVAAMLEQAREDCAFGDAEAVNWIFADHEEGPGFSFVEVVNYLKLDPGEMVGDILHNMRDEVVLMYSDDFAEVDAERASRGLPRNPVDTLDDLIEVKNGIEQC